MTTRWERLADDLREGIRSGKYPPGELLPSYRLLGEQYDTSYGTVRTALMILRAEGWIVGEQGIGVRVREDHPD
jgi:GntR family transcriptional regulator